MNLTTRRMVESAILIAIGTVLSIFSFSFPWVMGGGITFCSMLPLVLISWRHGTRWGLFSAFCYALLQIVIGGMSNIAYGRTLQEMLFIALLDYVLAFTVIGLSSVFRNRLGNNLLEVSVGILFTYSLRFLCHFISGWLIWEAISPNEKNMLPIIYSFSYNISYMLPETLIALTVAIPIFLSIKKYWLGEDMKKAYRE